MRRSELVKIALQGRNGQPRSVLVTMTASARHGRRAGQARGPEARVEPHDPERRVAPGPGYAGLQDGAVRDGRPVGHLPDLRVLRHGTVDGRSRESQTVVVCKAYGHRDNADRKAAVTRLDRGTLRAWSCADGPVTKREPFKRPRPSGNRRPSGQG